jgi:hypothetical protein
MDIVTSNTYKDAPHIQNSNNHINGISSTTKMRMLGDFLQKNDVDIALLQEVAHDNCDSLRLYKAIVNEGT